MFFKLWRNIKNYIRHTTCSEPVCSGRSIPLCNDISLGDQNMHMLNNALPTHTEVFSRKFYYVSRMFLNM